MQTHATSPRIDVASFGFVVSCVAAAALVGCMAVAIDRERACAWSESVATAFCNLPAAGSAEQADMLRARIARDPGDANAYTTLALEDRSTDRERLVSVASALAPREPNLMLARAAYAFSREDWDAAAPPLVELADHRDDVPLALSALSYLLKTGRSSRLVAYVKPDSQWVARLLLHMRASGGSLSGALPLIIRAVNVGALEPETVRSYVRDLKSTGEWADAYALWLSLHGKSVPLLFNPSFDHAFETDGFDWEAPARAPGRRSGVVLERRRAEQRGGVLDLQFTGHAVAMPIIRQYLFIAPGRYRLHGDYMGHHFRSEEGLTWFVRCGSASAGQSGPLRDTLGLWHPFEFDFVVPADCGVVASLQPETTAPAEASLGARGGISFDAFSLERISP